MPIDIVNESTTNAMGGTELQAYELQRRLPPELLEKFQIIPSRVRTLDPSLKRIYWVHDLPGDPENTHLANGGYNQFERLVFVSNWQMQAFINHYSIPWYKCVVLQNAIQPLSKRNDEVKGEGDAVNIIYHTTPHRGLNLLVSIFDRLVQEHPNVHLDVYSSFKIYGWEERDKPFEAIFDYCRNHPNITYHGAVSNDDVKAAISKADIFAYPSTWLETSCISLIEAMSAGLICVHPNYGALPETAANWTSMYQYQDSERDHAKMLYAMLDRAVDVASAGVTRDTLFNQKAYTDMFYNWDLRGLQWEAFLRSLL